MNKMTWAAMALSLAIIGFSAGAQAKTSAGAALYKSKCTGCHGADGSANTPIGKALKASDLRSDAVQKKTDAQLSAVIRNGGAKMPPVGKMLKPAQVKDLVSFIRTFKKK